MKSILESFHVFKFVFFCEELDGLCLNDFFSLFVAHPISAIEPSDCEKQNKDAEFAEKRTHTKMTLNACSALFGDLYSLFYPV